MRSFQATVFTPAGEELLVRIQGATMEVVKGHLHEQGYTIKKIAEFQETSLWKKLQDIEVGQRIKPENRIRLLKSLGQMIGRGYVVENIIDFLLADEKQKDVIKLLTILQEKTQKGYKDYVELFREAGGLL